jgi:ketosteroid isomerase-like protein
MKFLPYIIYCLFVFSSISATAQNEMEAFILEKETAWANAVKEADVAALENLYDSALIYTHSSGVVDTKTEYINNLKTGTTVYKTITRDDIKCTLHGKTAIVTAHTVFEVLNNGTPITANTRMIHVWVKKGKSWKLVAHQTTKI